MHDKSEKNIAPSIRRDKFDKSEFRPASQDDLDQKLFAKNLNAWISRFPEIAIKLKAQKPTKSNLVIDADNDYDIKIDGKLLIGQGSLKWSSQSHLNFHSAIRLNFVYEQPVSNNNRFFQNTNIVPAILKTRKSVSISLY